MLVKALTPFDFVQGRLRARGFIEEGNRRDWLEFGKLP